MNKLLTIIIPTYNMEKYLRRCLDSLIVDEEGMKLLEVLVVNDGSKDSSSAIAHEYQDMYPNTYRVIDKENGNYGSCINRGLKEATGKYVKVLDADDWFDNENFRTFINILIGIDVDLIISNYCVVNENNKQKNFSKVGLKPYVTLFFPNSYKKIMHLQMHQVTYKLRNILGINYTQSEGISYTDQEWMFSPMTTVTTIYYYPESIYNYLVGRDGQTMDKTQLLKNYSHTLIGTKKMVAEYLKFNIESNVFESYLLNRISMRLKYIYMTYKNNQSRLDSQQYNDFVSYVVKNIPRTWSRVVLLCNIRRLNILKYFRNK